MSNEANDEAKRIWQFPREQWREEIKNLPKQKKLNNVMWPLRQAVISRLQMAEKMEAARCLPAGWPDRQQ
jgi:hypothetical protein